VGQRERSSNGGSGDRTENNVKKIEREQVGVSGLVRLHRDAWTVLHKATEERRAPDPHKQCPSLSSERMLYAVDLVGRKVT
jgi:hypothetical protein